MGSVSPALESGERVAPWRAGTKEAEEQDHGTKQPGQAAAEGSGQEARRVLKRYF